MANIFHVHRVNDAITLGQSETTITCNSLTASKLIATDASKILTSSIESLSPTFTDLTLSEPSNIYTLSHNSFTDFVADEHIAHSGVILTAGTGLIGGGDISANRTFNVDIGIADDKIVQIDDADAADDDYAKFTLNGLEGRSYTEVKTDLNLNLVENTALSTWVGTANITTVGTLTSGGIGAGFTEIGTDYTAAKCTDATADNTAGNETSHADVVVDGDFTSNGILNRTGAGSYSILALGTDVQAYHADLAAIAGGTWTGAASITTVGTIATGTWEATDVGIAHGGTGQSTQQAAINALTNVSAATNEHVLTKDTATGNAIFKVVAGGGTDEKVKIDAAATAGYIGAANSDGVLRCSANSTGGLSYTDGGDYVTIDLSINGLAELNPPTLAQTYIPVYSTGTSTQYKTLATNFGFFVDRGDVASYDWDETTLTEDGTWHDLDCSSVVPAGAKAILFGIVIKYTASNHSFKLRENDNSNTINVVWIITQVANVYNCADAIVACDANRVVEYYASSVAWTQIDLVIKGWWF